ncbi:type I methionyl aminopeptidase [Candidatus Peregrinibacteria bacterium]|nr:MAG: type I methionyl aminopeptidase [Candidatus Peregrinibacteria bacterium]
MITYKNKAEQKKMRQAGKLAAQVLEFIEPHVQPGISTEALNTLCHDFIVSHHAIPAPLNYHGFPKSICTSVNHVICHGIPSPDDILTDGDIINIDITVIKDGFHGDTSKTFLVGNVSEKNKLLVERTHNAMMRGIAVVKPGVPLHKIGRTIEKYINKFGYGIVEDYTGHGIGIKFHEEPSVLHYDHTDDIMIKEGMTFTVEPMINQSSDGRSITDKKDGWTVYTTDNALSAQFEHTILVTATGHEILTQL